MTTDPETKTRLEEAIDSLFAELNGLNADSDEYARMVTQLDKLYKMKLAEQELTNKFYFTACEVDLKTEESRKEKPNRLSMDTLVAAGANLAGIAMILGYERVHVVTSKALGFVIKAKM